MKPRRKLPFIFLVVKKYTDKETKDCKDKKHTLFTVTSGVSLLRTQLSPGLYDKFSYTMYKDEPIGLTVKVEIRQNGGK